MTFGTHPLKRDDPLLPKAIVRPTGKSSGTARKPTELSPEEKALLEKVHKDQATPQPPAYGHMHVIQPLSAKKSKKKTKAPMRAQATSMTQTPDPDILELAINNDRDVASLAREATANRKKDPPDEVVISLH